MKIKILVPYFGPLPSWLNFFLASCASNDRIEWLLIVDRDIPTSVPDNVHVQKISLEQYCLKISKALNINFKPASGYKLCDIRPALAPVHADFIADSDFWAYGDLDLIYGDLQGHIETLDLKGAGIVSFHGHRLSGHLTMIRNNEMMNNAFKQVPHWQKVLEEPEHSCFDEKHFNSIFIKHKSPSRNLKALFRGDGKYRKLAFFHETYNTPYANVAWVDGSKTFPESWVYENGKVFSNDELRKELPYLHFLTWKKNWPIDTVFLASPAAKNWLINESGFQPMTKETD